MEFTINIPGLENPSYTEYMDAVIEKLGGPEQFQPILPDTVENISAKLKEDEHLNNIPLHKWDEACGFKEIKNRQPPKYAIADHNNPLQCKLRQIFGKTASVSECISILKHAATLLCQEYGFQKSCYEAYQLHWMITHQHSLREFADEIVDMVESADDPDPRPFETWEYDRGFNGSIYACFQEFLETEYQDETFMALLCILMPPVNGTNPWELYKKYTSRK